MTTAETLDAPAVSLAAQVEHLEARRDALAEQVATARAAVHTAERGFLDGTTSAADLAAAKAELSAYDGALATVAGELAPLRAQLDAEQAAEQARTVRAEQWARLQALAAEGAAAVDEIGQVRDAAIAALDASARQIWQLRAQAMRAQTAFLALLEDYAGEDADAQVRTIRKLEQAGADTRGVIAELGQGTMLLNRYVVAVPIPRPDRGPFTGAFDRYALEMGLRIEPAA